MNKYLAHYHSQTLASLSNRSGQQLDSHPIWNFVFEHSGIVVTIFDDLEIHESIKLHNGLNIIVQLSVDNKQIAEEESRNYTETILNLLTLSTLAYCGSAQMKSIIDITNIQNAEYIGTQKLFNQNRIPPGSLRKIEPSDFSVIFKAFDSNPYQQRIIRSLSWLRKGINEENDVDEFIALWTGLEVVKGVLRKKLKLKVKDPDEWDGLRDVFDKKVGVSVFEDIKNARNELLHGHMEIGHDFVRKIKSFIKPTREALIYSIADILLLDDELTRKIISMGIRRSNGIWSVIGAHLENLPGDIMEVLKKFPSAIGKIQSEKFEINGEKISYNPRITYSFSCPKDTRWRKDFMELRGDENAGFESTFSTPTITVESKGHKE